MCMLDTQLLVGVASIVRVGVCSWVESSGAYPRSECKCSLTLIIYQVQTMRRREVMSCLIYSASPVAMVYPHHRSKCTSTYHYTIMCNCQWHPSLLNVQPVLVIHPHRSMHKECVSSPGQTRKSKDSFHTCIVKLHVFSGVFLGVLTRKSSGATQQKSNVQPPKSSFKESQQVKCLVNHW